MSRLATAGFVAIVTVAGLIAWRVAEPPRLMADPGAGNRDLLSGMATGIAAQSLALTPTVTPRPTLTPTRYPTKQPEPTETPLPTYGPDAAPGLYVIPESTADVYDVVDWPRCAVLAATPAARLVDRTCEVK